MTTQAQEILEGLHDFAVMKVSQHEYEHEDSIKEASKLTADIAIKFKSWCDEDASNIAIHNQSDEELFDYFITKVYQK